MKNSRSGLLVLMLFGVTVAGAIPAIAVGQSANFKGNDWKIIGGVGAGIRYLLSVKNGLNISLDYAYGKDSDAVYYRS